MRRNLIRNWLAIIALSILSLGLQVSKIKHEAKEQSSVLCAPLLSADDKEQISEALRLQTVLGDQIWPGFGQAKIPIILFNDRYEFLVCETNPPAPWAAVKDENFDGKPYYRRLADKPQAFAVPVGTRWAGSLNTLGEMNLKSPLKISREIHVVAMLHEMFHAYKAMQASARFAKAMAVYAAESRYPSKEAEFAAAWNKEGSLLAIALRTTEEATVQNLVRQFLQARDDRRAKAVLSTDLFAYECELEWLEGLAKYVEIQFYELAAAKSADPAFSNYIPNLPYWKWDFQRLERRLGHQDGDLRFYLSGMAQARLLDRLSPGWKEAVIRSSACLEDILRAAVRQR